MTRNRTIIIAALALIAATAGFTITRAARSDAAATNPIDPATRTLLDWLDVPADQQAKVHQQDPAFGADLKTLRDDLTRCRTELAAALEKPQTSNDVLTNLSEASITAENALERRIMKHLLSVRQHLTPEQQQRLFGLCAQGVREGCRFRQGMGMGPGGRGMGRGMMNGRR